MSIAKHLPDPEHLLALEPEELAGLLLQYLNALPSGEKNALKSVQLQPSAHGSGLPCRVPRPDQPGADGSLGVAGTRRVSRTKTGVPTRSWRTCRSRPRGSRADSHSSRPRGGPSPTRRLTRASHEGVAAIDRFLRAGTAMDYTSRASGAPTSLPAASNGLTPREVQVLRQVAAGSTNKEIASELGVAVSTVERHLVNLYTKIGARGRADAIAYALRHRLGASLD